MRNISTSWVIHGFALLHVIATIICMLVGVNDSLILTVFTMMMTVIICYRETLTVEITVASIVLVNVLGFLLGNLGALIVFVYFPPLLQHSLSTLIVTELMGWGLYGFANIFPRQGAAEYERDRSWDKHKIVLSGFIAIIVGVRFFLSESYTGNIFKDSTVVGLLVVATVFAFTYMVAVAIRMQGEAASQRTRRHQAEFRYMTLKHQVNPHFLFNSLNVLDSIVHDGSREEASEYIHKMAAIYRYLVKQETEKVVPIADEIDFAKNYRELIEIRFPEGLKFMDHGITTDPPKGYIVPCTLQLLLENAIKHNAFSVEEPLLIELSTDGKTISMKNNLRPKAFTKPSTGIGLQYIRNQYRDLADMEIVVERSSDAFKVSLPILQNPDISVNLQRERKHL